jgi:hypothetical protein
MDARCEALLFLNLLTTRALSFQLILELATANEKLEEQNRRLRIEYLALRQAARDAGLNSVLVNSTLLGVPDETLGIDTAAKQAAGDAREAEGTSSSPETQSGGGGARRALRRASREQRTR